MSTYVTHAHTLEELRQEFLSDINRRIDMLQGQSNVVGKSVAEKSRLGSAIRELEDLQRYWTQIQLIRAKRK